MSKTADAKTKVRLEPEHLEKLEKIQSECRFRPSIGALANEAISFGIPQLAKACAVGMKKSRRIPLTRGKSAVVDDAKMVLYG